MTSRLRDLLWIPINGLQALWIVYWTALCITLALLVRVVTGSTRISLGMARFLWAPGLLVFGPYPFEVTAEGETDWTRTYFIVSNHQSFLDIPLLFRALPVNLHFVVKSELQKVPFLAWYINAMGMVFVDRRDREAARSSVERTARAALSGKSILLFPEGTRSKDGEVGQFKSGMMAAAIAGSVPVLPVAVEGPGEAMPSGWPRLRPKRLRVAIGQPIETVDFGEDDRRLLTDRVRDEVVRLHRSLKSR
ncbi:MAG: lysophospholipid acyltransferase family protein [Acidobacteriota bacterium]